MTSMLNPTILRLSTQALLGRRFSEIAESAADQQRRRSRRRLQEFPPRYHRSTLACL